MGWLLLRWRARAVSGSVVLGRYLVMAGALRFLVEFIRVTERVALGLSVAHLASVLAVGLGVTLLLSDRSSHSEARKSASDWSR
jgi:prolipoprotein diacylglyceryltransferase